ncbi:MAG: transglutaminase domain-containing protein [Planctomycetaceae bacterium]|nr:transglutaminase domain-containing protein [Planctomycetaceae bacterium]
MQQRRSGARGFAIPFGCVLRLGLACGIAGFLAAAPHVRAEEEDEEIFAIVDGEVVRTEEDSAAPGAEEPAARVKPPAGAKPPKYANRFAMPDPALELIDPRIYRLRVIIRIDSPESAAKNVVATGPIPMDWPEQRVRLISEKMTPHCKSSETVLKGQAAYLTFNVPQIAKGGSAFVERLYELTRYRTRFLLPPEDMKLARQAPKELKPQLAGVPPGVEIDSPQMIALAESLRGTDEKAPAWDLVKSLWSWTRDNVEFQNGDFRGALYAIENRCGDCEEMSALFVGLCRLNGIHARTVWVEGHDYPEFYLLDQQGKGHWIPAQVVGPPWFGEITEYRPIFQKGDRFYDGLQKTYVRYVPTTVRGADAKVQPRVDFRHEILADSDINGPSYVNPKRVVP